ncbi:hypothetical protein [Nocardia fluminea]|uniref:hypothetical protein n=1 Tax=Nocardia fluminea TaxID=134984 RepID=UPI003D0FC1B9
MTSVPIYEDSRVDELTWYVWDDTEFDFVSVGVREPAESPHRSIIASVGGVAVQRVTFEAGTVVAVRYFEVEDLDEAVAWHIRAYPNVYGDVWGVFKDSVDGCSRDGIAVAQASLLKRTERLDAKGDLVAEAWYSIDGRDLLEMKEYEYGDDGELSATLLYGRGGVLIDRYEED